MNKGNSSFDNTEQHRLNLTGRVNMNMPQKEWHFQFGPIKTSDAFPFVNLLTAELNAGIVICTLLRIPISQ